MSRRRVIMISSEVGPWARSGGLADVLQALPGALAALGHKVAVVAPRYMNAASAPAEKIVDRMPIALGANIRQAGLWAMKEGGVTHYFLENAALYDRPGLYGDASGDFADNHIRFAFLCRAALEISRQWFHAHVFHCHDWQAALLPVYLKEVLAGDPDFAGAKTLLTIHNLGYQGLFPSQALDEIGLGPHLFHPAAMEFWGQVNFLKSGIVFSDAINTVSRKYAEEIQTPDYGFGLDGLLRERGSVLSGILNGADYARWNPADDSSIAAPFTPEDLGGKRECKRALLAEMGLPERLMERPLIGIVSRFASQKGFDLIGEIAGEIFRDDIGMVVLGNGEARYEELFRKLSAEFPEKVAVRFGFNDALAHRIEAGSDIFLMPSAYEPCGLNQIYSLKYGTVPVVRATGGLDDTIDEATGFKFAPYNGGALLACLRDACRAWEDHATWTLRMVRGMRKDFSWRPAAQAYSELYERL